MSEYDISRAFKRIENDLMDSMMRNLKRHQAEETDLGIEWEQWQALQLKELERYRKQNADKFTDDFDQINRKVDAMFRATCNDAQSKQENYLLEQIKKGDFTPTQTKDTQFFNLNDAKLNILIERTKADFTRAEYAMLRKADDAYRQTIFDAQVYASVTNDYAKAIDMATHDFLMKGIQCVQYSNGAKHTLENYAEMCVRTGNKRAYLMGEGNAHDKYGIHTVRVNKRTQACPKCVKFLGRVLIDDVYSSGTAKEASDLGVPTLSSAIQAGFLHPNCKDIYSLYIPNVSKPATPWTQSEINDIVGDYNQEQELKHAQDMSDSYLRLAKYALSPENKAIYEARADNWQNRITELQGTTPQPIQVEQPTISVKELLEKSTTPTEIQDLMSQQEWFYVEGDWYDGNKLIDLTKADVDGSKDIFNAFDRTFEKYPQLKGKLAPPNVGKTFKSDDLAECIWGFGRGGITGNVKYYGNYRFLEKASARGVSMGFHPKNTPPNAIMVHEIGHAIDDMLTNLYHLNGAKYKSVSSELRAKVAKRAGVSVKDMRLEVSEYATKNAHEWFAECFAEYMTSPNPRKVATVFGEMLDEIMQGIE